MKNIDFKLLSDQLKKGKPGFQKFRNKVDGKYYFKYHDKSGHPLIFSHPYQSAKSRDEGYKRILAYLSEAKGYKPMKEGNKWYFSIRAGNHQEVARSILLSTEKEMKQKLASVQEAFFGKKKKSKARKVQVEKVKAKMAKKQTASEEDQLSRFKFDLVFYRPAEGEPLVGKIEYPLEEEKATFEGLDLEKIKAFLSSYLPIGEPAIPKPDKKMLPSLEAPIIVTFDLLEDSVKIDQKSLHLNKEVELLVKISPEQKDIILNNYQAIVRAKSFGQPSQERIVGKMKGVLSPNSELKLPLSIGGLPSGLYHISLEVSLKNRIDPEKQRMLKGDRIVQVLEPWSVFAN